MNKKEKGETGEIGVIENIDVDMMSDETQKGRKNPREF